VIELHRHPALFLVLYKPREYKPVVVTWVEVDAGGGEPWLEEDVPPLDCSNLVGGVLS